MHSKNVIFNLLINATIRQRFQISSENPFVLATTNTSHKIKHPHLDGWHALKDSIKPLSLTNAEKINATKNRHYISTIYASLHIENPEERQCFYDHLGHGADINKDNYQCPPALRTIKTVGKRLLQIEKSKCTILFCLILFCYF